MNELERKILTDMATHYLYRFEKVAGVHRITKSYDKTEEILRGAQISNLDPVELVELAEYANRECGSFYDKYTGTYQPLSEKDKRDECHLWSCDNRQYRKGLCGKHYRIRYIQKESIGTPWNGPDED